MVVGLGGSGLSAIRHAVERGLSVVGLDAAEVGAGAAGRNAGFALGGLAADQPSVAAYRATLAELDRWDADAGVHHFRRTGSLRIADDGDELAELERLAAWMAAASLPVDRYEGPEGAGLLFPADGAIEPLERCRDLADAARAAGARLEEHTPVTDVVALADEWNTPVVVAIDGGLERVVPALAGRVRTTRLQMLATAPTDDVHLKRPVYRRHGYDYWRQLADGRVILGGRRDRFAAEEWDALDAVPTAPVQAELDRLLRDVAGVRHATVTDRWAALVSYTDDRLPVIETVAPGIVACGAYSGTGNVIGALAGRAAVDLVLDGHSDLADLLTDPPLSR